MEDLEWWFVTLLIPLGVWTFQQIGEVWRRWKRQDFLYNNILAEIERTQKENAVLKVAIVQALGSEAFRDRVKEPNYFIFVGDWRLFTIGVQKRRPRVFAVGAQSEQHHHRIL